MDIIRLDRQFDRWEELRTLILESFAYMKDRIDPPSSALLLTPDALRLRADREIAFAALDESKILLGCLFARPEPDCLYLGKLAVLPSDQRRGIGWMLLGLAENEARTRHLHQLRLETRIELTENHAIFRAWGFRQTAENAHPGYDRPTSIEMRKDL